MASTTRFSRLTLLFLFSANLIPHISAFTQCYYPDGSIPVDYIWLPCVGTGHSSCCIPSEGDICQPNGLCWYPLTNLTFRGACTDRTWNDPACPKDICVAGNEDTWAWSSPCSQEDSNDVSYACGKVEDRIKVTANCTAGATTNRAIFRTEEPSTSKPTRYTSPPPVDTGKFTVYTETYTTKISAWVQDTTVTTTWESTITSALGQVSGTGSNGGYEGPSITGTRGGFVTTSASPSSSSSPPSGGGGGITMSPGTLGAAIAGPIVGIALIGFLFWFLRRKRAAKRESEAGTRLNSSPTHNNSNIPPANGPVGADQVVPYEVPANEVSLAGAYAPDKKYLYTPPPPNAGAYEMSSAGEKGWGGYGHGQGNHGAAEVSGDASPGAQHISRTATPVSAGGIRSPAPVYSERSDGPVVLPVELDAGHYGSPTPPVGSNRNGVSNA